MVSALRIVAEEGTPDEAYNVAARELLTLGQRLEHVGDALDRDIELVHASEDELTGYDLATSDFPLVRPVPVIIDTTQIWPRPGGSRRRTLRPSTGLSTNIWRAIGPGATTVPTVR